MDLRDGELRKAIAKVFGWKRDAVREYWHTPLCDGDFLHCDYSGHCNDVRLPHYESYPAVSEPALEEFCSKRGLFYRHDRHLDGVHIFRIFDTHGQMIGIGTATPDEKLTDVASTARARAIVAAAEKF